MKLIKTIALSLLIVAPTLFGGQTAPYRKPLPPVPGQPVVYNVPAGLQPAQANTAVRIVPVELQSDETTAQPQPAPKKKKHICLRALGHIARVARDGVTGRESGPDSATERGVERAQGFTGQGE